ncbi:MAG: hypothetical protein OEV91_03835 [Desulfobulbaceae bacterium]|nr:hypothetical protein [Desulfobulbaceae bacterium]
MAFQRATDRVFREGRGLCFEKPVSVTEWFGLADFFVSLVRRGAQGGTGSLQRFLAIIGVPLPLELPSVAGAGVELLGVNERQRLLGATWRLLAADIDCFEYGFKASQLTRQGFCGHGIHVPFLLCDMVEELPDRSLARRRRPRRMIMAGPRPRNEVLRMMARLERKLEMMRR